MFQGKSVPYVIEWLGTNTLWFKFMNDEPFMDDDGVDYSIMC